MFVSRGQFGGGMARARYQSVDLESRIEGATPHQLVVIMFEELLKSLDAMAVALQRGDVAQRGQRQSRAFAILNGLEGSLDFDKGGEIAEGLASIYREARRLTIAGGQANDPQQILRASEMLREVAGAWAQIGKPQ